MRVSKYKQIQRVARTQVMKEKYLTFTFDGFLYPKDSIYAEVMAPFMFHPTFCSFSRDLWENTKQYGIEHNLTVEGMKQYLEDKRKGKPSPGPELVQMLTQ